MTTEKAIEANRRNALKSTGPKSPEGKARSSANAVKHGLSSGTWLLLDEDHEEFEAFTAGLFCALDPKGPLESALVDRIAGLFWRLGRAERLAGELIEFGAGALPGPEYRAIIDGLRRYGGTGLDALGRLDRHEAALDRALSRALHELERIQARRRGEVVGAPMVVDLTLSAPEDGFVLQKQSLGARRE